MPPRQRDVKVRILSEYYDAGSKAAERAQRRLASLQMAAAREDVAREQARSAAIVAANRAQMDAMQQAGRVTLGLSAAIAVGLGISAKAAMDWESAFAGVRKVVDGSPEEISALEAELRGLATTLPASHEAIAGVAEVAGQLGVARQDIAAFTRTAIDMGETTNMAADEAATSMAQLSNIMGIAAGDAGKLGSTIVELGNNGASTERDIVSMALRIAGAGRTVGMTADQVLSVASALSSVGLEAEAGGSAISRVLIQIDKDVSSGADTLATYAQVSGMSVEAFRKHWQTDATGAVTAFIGGLGRMQKAGGDVNATLDTLGFTEIRTSDALRRAALAGDLLADAVETGSRAWEENIALTEEANKRYQTTEARLQIARNKLNDVAIDVGGHVLPVIADAAEGVGSLAAGFGALPDPVKQWATQLGMAALGLTGVIGGAAVVIPKLKALKDTVDALHGGSSRFGKALGGVTSFLTGPWGLALGGATIALGVWMKAQGEAAQRTEALSRTLDEQTGALTEASSAWVQAELTKTQNFGIRNNKSMVDAAEEMGISLEVLTRAYMGNVSAQREAKAAAEEWASANYDLGLASTSLADRFTRNIDDQNDRLRQARELQQARVQIDSEAVTTQDRLAERYGITTGSLEDQNAVLADGTILVEDAAAAVDTLSKALDELNSPALNAREAERRFHDAVAEASAALKENGATLDVHTEAGRRNQEVLDGIATAGMRRAQAILEQTGSEDAFRAALDEARAALFEQAKQYGATDEEAQAYIDTVLGIPTEVTTVAEIETTAAQTAIDQLITRNQGKRIRLTAEISTSGQPVYVTAAGTKMERDGGLLEFFARGALRPMKPLAEVVPPNTWRVIGDHPKADELYVPLDGSQRSRAIWELGGQRMGWSMPAGGAGSPAGAGGSLAGLLIEGTLVTPWGPAEVRGVVREELAQAQSSRTSTLRQGVR